MAVEVALAVLLRCCLVLGVADGEGLAVFPLLSGKRLNTRET